MGASIFARYSSVTFFSIRLISKKYPKVEKIKDRASRLKIRTVLKNQITWLSLMLVEAAPSFRIN